MAFSKCGVGITLPEPHKDAIYINYLFVIIHPKLLLYNVIIWKSISKLYLFIFLDCNFNCNCDCFSQCRQYIQMNTTLRKVSNGYGALIDCLFKWVKLQCVVRLTK